MERLPQSDAQMSAEKGHASPESIETLHQLRKYVEQGYLLHGSKRLSETLEPRQAHDTDREKVIGNQVAVYAMHHLEAPLFMALKDKKDHSLPSAKSEYHGNSDGVWHMSGDNITLSPGYIYVLSPDTFETIQDENGDEELVSRVPVTAEAILTVTPDIFTLFPNVTLDLN